MMLYVKDKLNLDNGRMIIEFVHVEQDRKVYKITGRNYSFTTFLVISDGGETANISHDGRKHYVDRSLISMTERKLKCAIDEIIQIDDINEPESSSSKVNNVAYKPQVKNKPVLLTEPTLKKYEPIQLREPEAIKMNYTPKSDPNRKSIADEISKNSQPLTDFSKDLMVTAEVSFATANHSNKKKQIPKEEYKIKVFGKSDGKSYKEQDKHQSQKVLKTIWSLIKMLLGLGSMYAVFQLVRHYIIK